MASNGRSGLFGCDCFSFLAPLGLLFQPLLYCNQVFFAVGWRTRSPGLLHRLNQLEVAVS
ncbi:hypothetical protein D3C80_605930 [compost metagenome]